MFLAKPNSLNYIGAKQFQTTKEAKAFLDSFIEDDEDFRKMSVDDWCYMGKILEVLPDGSYATIQINEEEYLK
jgi:hypothetical protein